MRRTRAELKFKAHSWHENTVDAPRFFRRMIQTDGIKSPRATILQRPNILQREKFVLRSEDKCVVTAVQKRERGRLQLPAEFTIVHIIRGLSGFLQPLGNRVALVHSEIFVLISHFGNHARLYVRRRIAVRRFPANISHTLTRAALVVFARYDRRRARETPDPNC